MEKVANIASSFEEADRWDRDQRSRMTLLERVDAVEFLREQCLVVAGRIEIPRIEKKGVILSHAMKLHPDFSAFIDVLQKHEVQFMIVGSFALALHGHPRATGDIDLWIRPTPDNARAVVDAVKEFGFGFMNVVEDDILSGKIIQMGVPPVRIDLISVLDGLTAEEAWDNREDGQLGKFNVYFIGKQAYIRNKLAVGRHKDLADVESLGVEGE